MTFRFLGTGTSVGVPQIGCSCPVCTSTDPRDRRRRCGAYVSSPAGAFLIDTPPELRLACVEYGINKVDAVCLTHAHMDHVAAFDDLRRFNTINGKTVLPCYALPETITAMRCIFPYISQEGGRNGLYRPQIDYISNETPFRIGDITVEAIRVGHGFPCCGYILNRKLAYISDCHELSDAVLRQLQGIDTMILNCLREREHPTHLSRVRALAYLEQIAPHRAYLVHMCHDLSHQDWLAYLPPQIEPAYDGLELTF